MEIWRPAGLRVVGSKSELEQGLDGGGRGGRGNYKRLSKTEMNSTCDARPIATPEPKIMVRKRARCPQHICTPAPWTSAQSLHEAPDFCITLARAPAHCIRAKLPHNFA